MWWSFFRSSHPQPDAPDAATLAERRKARLDEKKTYTLRTSETCRYICFGLLATFYTLLTTKDSDATRIAGQSPVLLDVMALLAAAALTFDYLQYLAARFAVDRALNSADQLYGDHWLWPKLRQFLYWAKQVLMLVAVVVFFAVLLRYLAISGPTPP